MIIRFPTALYLSILPQKPQDGGNTTFTISNNDPPRLIPLSLPQVPPGVEYRQRGQFTSTTDGGLVYSIITSSPKTVESGAKQFEVGDVLEFDNLEPQIADPMLVSDDLTIQHNTNLLDLTDLGLSSEEQDDLESKSSLALASLKTQLNGLRASRMDIDLQIASTQKQINEATKTVGAAEILVSVDPSIQPILDKMRLKQEGLQIQLDFLVSQAGVVAAQAEDVANKIRSVTQLVR